jgi:putative NIF3 family GTP cyclohydrolase 1 type 2
MQVKEIFDLGIEMGIEVDLRGKARVKKILERKREEFKKLDEAKRDLFDQEALKHPYADSRIHLDFNKGVKKVMAGIDIETQEVLLAQSLKDVDLLIAHHPLGRSLAALSEVMDLQVDALNLFGVPVNIAERVLEPRIAEVTRGVSPINHYRGITAAKLLGFQLINLHTPCDNLVTHFLMKKFEKENPENLGDVLNILMGIEEYREAAKLGEGPALFSGSEKNRVGKISFSELTGGTEGSKEIYEKMAQAGIGTIISMHQSEDLRKEAEKAKINVVVAGHMASDSIGMNLYLDELEKKGIEIIPFSGLIRVKRF